ncbi:MULTISPECIES: hypothetical protein [Ancylobacter]|uniref:LPS-assembly lipoprotein n=1 Tax=Ancylobacter defluvii TaxID=1282440 RepID=A0A9W6JX35_9HYPH|nr:MULTISPECIES: hypothetical protein [Ancylobacter]MBS7587180.1 hypothetical protein [Ancylobacter defluvii]MDR6952572.1 LPS-assembly lipoprotein [Ancylobacter sp. 3268]GLK83494.1 hypothetical protein GCM10017653_15630 [Ancylobacter defluvii]
MSSPDLPRTAPTRRRLVALAAVVLLSGLTAGCFRPMYANSSNEAGTGLSDQLGDVEVVFAPGRVGNEVRNDLIFALTGGAGNPAGAPYRLVLNVTDNTTSAIIDPVSGLPEVELITVDSKWQLFEAGNDKKPVMASNAYGKASIDSGYQRFARARAIRDAQNRASTVVAETIRSQLAVYFSNKTAAASVSPNAASTVVTDPSTPIIGTPTSARPRS